MIVIKAQYAIRVKRKLKFLGSFDSRLLSTVKKGLNFVGCQRYDLANLNSFKILRQFLFNTDMNITFRDEVYRI